MTGLFTSTLYWMGLQVWCQADTFSNRLQLPNFLIGSGRFPRWSTYHRRRAFEVLGVGAGVLRSCPGLDENEQVRRGWQLPHRYRLARKKKTVWVMSATVGRHEPRRQQI